MYAGSTDSAGVQEAQAQYLLQCEREVEERRNRMMLPSLSSEDEYSEEEEVLDVEATSVAPIVSSTNKETDSSEDEATAIIAKGLKEASGAIAMTKANKVQLQKEKENALLNDDEASPSSMANATEEPIVQDFEGALEPTAVCVSGTASLKLPLSVFEQWSLTDKGSENQPRP